MSEERDRFHKHGGGGFDTSDFEAHSADDIEQTETEADEQPKAEDEDSDFEAHRFHKHGGGGGV